PHVIGDLRYVSASLMTIMGMICSEWSKSENSLNLRVTIPVNSSAKIYIPKMSLKSIVVKEGNFVVWKSPGKFTATEDIKEGREEDGFVVLNVGSGCYRFELSEEKENRDDVS
ncbi:MAG: alpha-L-rhamnosidase C-terminal domain-containing protein, partial [Thermoproteota archaeon]